MAGARPRAALLAAILWIGCNFGTTKHIRDDFFTNWARMSPYTTDIDLASLHFFSTLIGSVTGPLLPLNPYERIPSLLSAVPNRRLTRECLATPGSGARLFGYAWARTADLFSLLAHQRVGLFASGLMNGYHTQHNI